VRESPVRDFSTPQKRCAGFALALSAAFIAWNAFFMLMFSGGKDDHELPWPVMLQAAVGFFVARCARWLQGVIGHLVPIWHSLWDIRLLFDSH
jgi:hypothetical protein